MKFVVDKKGIENIFDRNNIIEAYRLFFKKNHGADIVDLFLDVADMKPSNSRKKDVLESFSTNYKSAIDLVNNIKNDDDMVLLSIYNEDAFLGISRIKINDKELRVLDIVFIENDLEYQDILKETIMYIEEYFKNKNYKKMYIDIPIKDPTFLLVADTLGFKEDYEDIVEGIEYSYVYNKELI